MLQHRSLPLKAMQTAALEPSPTLRSLLMSQISAATTTTDNEHPPKATQQKTRIVSNASDVAAEALRITRETTEKGKLAELRPNGGKLYRYSS